MMSTAHQKRSSTQTPPLADVRRTFGACPTGLALIAAEVDGHDEAMLANSFTSISLDPPLDSMAFPHTSTTWPQLRQGQELGRADRGADHGRWGRVSARVAGLAWHRWYAALLSCRPEDLGRGFAPVR
ncbi:flavin reductase [Streptomyces sp. NPDC015242]|uniref:flavin reductase n=1 Tax=Streptomyces sp. NPDC015242 TaxID=3364951 RepID=UPI0036F89CB1